MDIQRRFVIGAWASSILLAYSLGASLPAESRGVDNSTYMHSMAIAYASPITEQSSQGTLATVTAYTCDSSMDAKQKAMNCPNGITASGTVPKHKQTAACDRSNLGRRFHIEGIGIVTCEDTGGAIKGPGRFDIFVETYAEAIAFGKRHISYEQL